MIRFFSSVPCTFFTPLVGVSPCLGIALLVGTALSLLLFKLRLILDFRMYNNLFVVVGHSFLIDVLGS